MKVFVTGATGYIGFNVAQAFRRAGHEVFGLVRSEEKSRALARSEIHPVLGSMQEPESYSDAAAECSVLVHAAADLSADTVALDKRTVETLLDAAWKGPRPKTVIYTSGVWVHGHTGARMVDETAPLDPPKLVSWRPAVEQEVLTAPGIKGLVLRPGCVYGRQGGMTGMWFGGACKEKSLRVVGDGNNHWAMVHVDDLAEGYLLAGERGYGGEIFNLTDRSRASVGVMTRAAACAAGYAGKIEFVPAAEAAKTMGDFAECLDLDQHVDARKAVRLLGWQPRHGGFVDEVETYFAAWKACQG
ncbi:MAG: NAD-dependent epimerase/dehydratase family protein [Deltaproteobacteria bacterium]|nr:NAD-dependent epimerase/dehydratase family protein [Deltaproteobacteria bacterium]